MTSADWRKSSYSSANGGNCVEVAMTWRKSSYSSGNGGNCVEVAAAGWQKSSHSSGNGGQCVEVARDMLGAVAVRDSKDPEGPKLAFTPAAWQEFTGLLKDGQFDLA